MTSARSAESLIGLPAMVGKSAHAIVRFVAPDQLPTALEHGTTLPAAAVQFALFLPAVASVVVGMRSPDEVRHNLPRTLSRYPTTYLLILNIKACYAAVKPDLDHEVMHPPRSLSRAALVTGLAGQ